MTTPIPADAWLERYRRGWPRYSMRWPRVSSSAGGRNRTPPGGVCLVMIPFARARDRMVVAAAAVWLAACAAKEPAGQARPPAAAGDAGPERARSEPAATPPAGPPAELAIQTELAAPMNARKVSAHGRPPVGFLELRAA